MKFLEIGESLLSPCNQPQFIGAAISAIGGALQQSSANRANFRNTQLTNKFNRQEAATPRRFIEQTDSCYFIRI